MEQRGRKSAAELTVITGDGITTIGRPAPWPDLTESQAVIWRDIVNRLPADWFPAETQPLLAQYCRHVVESRRIASLIERLVESEDFNIKDYDDLLRMQEREGRAASSLATRMRLTQQTTYSDRKTKGGSKPGRPWETGKQK